MSGVRVPCAVRLVRSTRSRRRPPCAPSWPHSLLWPSFLLWYTPEIYFAHLVTRDTPRCAVAVAFGPTAQRFSASSRSPRRTRSEPRAGAGRGPRLPSSACVYHERREAKKTVCALTLTPWMGSRAHRGPRSEAEQRPASSRARPPRQAQPTGQRQPPGRP